MFAIIDKRTPTNVKKNLEKYVIEYFEFSSEEITYNAISGHPDIFMFQDGKKLILAPNTPLNLISFLDTNKISYTVGLKSVGKSLEASVLYNCLTTPTFFFCNKGKPDESTLKNCADKQLIYLPQSFVRCSMFAIKNAIITSDRGIENVLKKHHIDYCFFDPTQIAIIDYKNGFIGGTMGAIDNKVFFLGNLLKHKDGKKLENYITNLEHEVICLGNDYLYDGGGIFFIAPSASI